jgi:TRAP-type mannitol/chloroaromatic compound transport system permease large subunit
VVAAKTISTPTIYRGVIPFVALQLIGLAIVVAYPGLVSGTIRFFRSLF